MRIGTSLSRCVRDIFDGKVSINEIMVIVARTDFDPENDIQWSNIWKGYAGNGTGSLFSNPEWFGYGEHEQAFRDICISLKKRGKLHQPRQFGAYPLHTDYVWYDLILTDEVVDSNPGVKKAWDNYKLIAGLS